MFGSHKSDLCYFKVRFKIRAVSLIRILLNLKPEISFEADAACSAWAGLIENLLVDKLA